jgi:dihydroxyacetone kinase
MLRSAILSAAATLEAQREVLCALDAETGDGNHGVTMTISARAVRRHLTSVADDDPATLFRAAADAGAAATAAMVGRSARFGERSRGTPDPGVSSYAISVEALTTGALTELRGPGPGLD